MNTVLHKANERGTGDYGWLKPNYYFSFAGYQNKDKVHFGALRVLNDDWIAGGGAFATHPHDNMEIITIPFTGALQHKDSTGGSGIIQAGDVQIMSAGSGVQHSEANASTTEPVTLFQIWVFPKLRNITPRYDQKTFNEEDRKNQWQVIVSPKNDNALWINHDAQFSLIDVEKDNTVTYCNLFSGNGVYLVLINGNVTVNQNTLNTRDALGIWDTDNFEIKANNNSTLLAIEIPMSF